MVSLDLRWLEMAGSLVTDPSIIGAGTIFLFGFVTELIAVLPAIITLVTPILFVEDALRSTFAIQFLFFVAVPFGIGNTLGSMPIYGLAYFGGKPAIDRFEKYLRFSWTDVERMEKIFKGLWYDELLFLLLRAIPLLPTLPVTIAAGILRMKPVPYLVLTAIGTVIKIMIMFLAIGLGIIAI